MASHLMLAAFGLQLKFDLIEEVFEEASRARASAAVEQRALSTGGSEAGGPDLAPGFVGRPPLSCRVGIAASAPSRARSLNGCFDAYAATMRQMT